MKIVFTDHDSDGTMTEAVYAKVVHCRPTQSKLVVISPQYFASFSIYRHVQAYAHRHGLVLELHPR